MYPHHNASRNATQSHSKNNPRGELSSIAVDARRMSSFDPTRPANDPRCWTLREQFKKLEAGQAIEPEPEGSLFDRLFVRLTRWRAQG
jgi:hypothetical protein